MAATPIRPDPRELAPIEDALHQARAGLAVLDAGMARLVETAFQPHKHAKAHLLDLLRRKGVDQTLAILEGRHPTIPRAMIGFLRGSLFKPGERARAKTATADLAALLPQRLQLVAKLDDLERARRALLDRADHDRLRGQTPDPARGRGRGRSGPEF